MKKIPLSEDEILVLSDWLNNFVNSKNFEELDNSIKRVLCDLNCTLEKENDFVFSNSYKELLSKAKSKITY